jgi:hypothetical protein
MATNRRELLKCKARKRSGSVFDEESVVVEAFETRVGVSLEVNCFDFLDLSK